MKIGDIVICTACTSPTECLCIIAEEHYLKNFWRLKILKKTVKTFFSKTLVHTSVPGPDVNDCVAPEQSLKVLSSAEELLSL